MDRELLRRRSRVASPSLPTFTDDSSRLGQEHDDQALTDPDPVAHILVSNNAWQSSAASIHEFHPTGGHGNVLSVHLESDLYSVGKGVTYVTALIAARTDLKQTALQVDRQLA